MKRLFDIFFATSGIIVTIPLFIFIAIAIKSSSKGPVLFLQKRVGQFDSDIRVFKFRTMIVDADKKGSLITVGNDPRITGIGRFLRKYKLDELPQLINVLVGNMSVVGPRPEVRKYIECYPRDVKDKVLSVKPGITDMASIEFRNENDMLAESEEPTKMYVEKILPIKQRYYEQYIDENNILLDIKIIILTLKKIIK